MTEEKLLRSTKRTRRPRISEEAKAKAVELYDAGDMSVVEIAKSCGFSAPTLYRILKEKGYK